MELARAATELQTKRMRVTPLGFSLFIAASLIIVRAGGTVGSDVAWQLWVATRLNHGAQLYRDIVEVNPPLWYWLARPIVSMAEALNARPERVLALAIGLFVFASLAALDRLTPQLPVGRKTFLLSFAASVMIALPWAHLGQREQIVLIGTIPYAALAAGRYRGAEISRRLGAAVGVVSALGFALKPHFLIVPVFLEVWIFTRNLKWRHVFRVETVTVTIVITVYLCTLLLFARNYLDDALPLVLLAYAAVGARSVSDLLSPSVLVSIVLMGLSLSQWRLFRARGAPLAQALLISAVGFACAYFIQFKGWSYHSMPMLACASLSLVSVLAESEGAPMAFTIISAPVLAIPFLFAFLETSNLDRSREVVQRQVRDLGPRSVVAFITTDNAVPWAVTLQNDLHYPSRFSAYWMLIAVVQNEWRGRPDGQLVKLGHEIVKETVQDYRCIPPDRIIAENPIPRFDIVSFFMRDPNFAELMKHYHKSGSTDFQVFNRASPLPKPTSPCRTDL